MLSGLYSEVGLADAVTVRVGDVAGCDEGSGVLAVPVGELGLDEGMTSIGVRRVVGWEDGGTGVSAGTVGTTWVGEASGVAVESGAHANIRAAANSSPALGNCGFLNWNLIMSPG